MKNPTSRERSLRIAAIQMVSGSRVAGNLSTAARLIAEAAEQGATLVVLPENFALMPNSEGDRRQAAERDSEGPIQEWLQSQALRHHIWVVGGTIPLLGSEGRLRSACLVFNDRGERVARYDKINLFDATLPSGGYTESQIFEAGGEVVVFAGPGFRVGIAVCYDLRFTAHFERLAALNAELIVVPSAFTEETGRAHWELLVRARSIDTLSFVAASAQGGAHENGRRTFGDTMVVSPWGEIMGRLGSGTGCVIADLNSTSLVEARRRLPALGERGTNAN